MNPRILALSLTIAVASVALVQDAPPTAGQTPSASEIMRVVKSVLDPRRSGTRELTLTLTSPEGGGREWRARQAWKTDETGSNRFVLVMETPMEVRGSAILVQEGRDAPNVQWVWLPAVGRVRKIVPISRFEGLFGTDFTYSDVGFLSLYGVTFGRVGSSRVDGVEVYVVEETVDGEPWYYSRIETVVDREKLWPRQRLFYTEAGDLWKRQTFERIEIVEGEPTLYAMRMENVPEQVGSAIVYADVDYKDVPDDVFEPAKLSKLLDHRVWGETTRATSEGQPR